ncbi:MAG: WYL domain-containing protein [Aeromonadaceae bacterium]
MSKETLTWDQTLRFRLLEIVLQWEGRLTTNHLCNAFNIGRQQASKDINRYIGEFSPTGLEYDRRLKGYRPTADFKPSFSQGSVNEYLHLLHQDKAQTSTLSLMDLRYGHTEVLDVPSRHVDPAIVRGLVQAARNQLRVDVDYASLSSEVVSGRNIVPHTLIYDGIRWHVRAYCEKRGEYLDFVMSRFRGVPDLLDASPHGREQDVEWSTQVELVIIPNPCLPPGQQAIIAQDYAMQDGQLRFSQRLPLVHYALDRMQVCYNDQHQQHPDNYPLLLKNRDELIAQGCKFKLATPDQ